jgi:hypothetical protein
MPQFLEIQTSRGPVLIHVAENLRSAAVGFQPASVAQNVVDKLQGGVEDAFGQVGELAERALAAVAKVATAPGEIALEFGISFSAQGSIIVATGTSEASFKISLTWKRP